MVFPRTRRRARTPSDEAPLRAELFSIAQLERHAHTLANWHRVGPAAGSRGDRLLARLDDNERLLRDAYAMVTDTVTRGRQITPAAEWFIDNYHLIEEQIRIARRHLPRRYNRELPCLINGSVAGMPRVYDLALQLISHAHGRVDLDALRAFIASYQSVQPLLLGELWAIPIMLRFALIENLRRVVAAVTAGRRDRARAGVWAERLLEVAASEPSRVVLALADMIHEDPPLTDPFVAELTSRLQGQGPALVFPISWLEHRLAERGDTIEHAYQRTAQSQAADQVSIGNSIGSLRFLGATDWRDFVESMSVVEQVLRGEPSGVYRAMDFATRDRYRHAIETIARRSPHSQQEIARRAVALAAAAEEPRQQHVGYFLVDGGRRALERAAQMRVLPSALRWLRGAVQRVRLPLYVGTGLAIACGLTALAAHLQPQLWPHAARPPAVLLGFWALVGFASLHLAIALVQWMATLLLAPRVLPRLDFSAGIPPGHRTAVAVPSLLSDAQTVDELLEQLEIRFLANRDAQLRFGLLTDFRDAPSATLPADEPLLRRVREGIEALNRRYGDGPDEGPFFLCHRARLWNAGERVWMGWERKRGKLEDFNALLRGARDRFAVTVGAGDRLAGVAFVMVLDSDTELPRDAARQLVGTLAHPLNRPVWRSEDGCATEGYTILQPRVGVTMPSVDRSRFARLFAGEPGIDPYTRAVSDVYQDVFAEGSFIGKGIYDVDAMRRACNGRLPENRILSHDLLEGGYGRAGLTSEVVLYEDFPATYAAEVNRRARWIRGDWQIARWLLPLVPAGDGRSVRNPISALSKLKILDNLRRSLVPIALLALLVAGFLIPGAALLGTAVVLLALLSPALLTAAGALARRPADVVPAQHVREVGAALTRHLLREAFSLACLPLEAVICFTAIARSMLRLLITRRRLLEWRTAADEARSARTGLLGTYASMWVQPFAALAVAAALAAQRSPAIWLAAPVLVTWLLAPGLAYWLSAPLRPALPRLSGDDLLFLRRVARRTWRFFEVAVTAEDHDLPPDNLQEDPPVGVAHRTSPTNIGCALAANLAACDLGYCTAGDLIDRTTRTFATLDRMPRYRGHFYNWYDTRTLEPLRPMYVSTVDSGNLTGFLLTLAAGLRELADDPVVRPAVFAGMHDTLDVLAEIAQPPLDVHAVRAILQLAPRTPADTQLALVRLGAALHDLVHAVEARRDPELTWWAHALRRQAGQALAELHQLAPWVELPPAPESAGIRELAAQLDGACSLARTAQLETTVLPAIDRALAAGADDGEPSRGSPRAWLSALRTAVITGAERASARLGDLQQLALRCGELGEHDVELLYDRNRHLLAIGYNVVDHKLDSGFYDLLASEARLASYIAVAQGKLPQEHWFRLGRQLTAAGGRPALLSWSGSMFEYLMPLLVMPTYPGTMLDTTYRAVVARQREYGRERGVPWGISESGYYKTDAHLNYQYRAFGVPGLGFKRGLADDLVIAPYASAMGLMVAPEAACANLRRLAREGRLGGCGFYEAVDYTQARLPPGKDDVTVQSYMAHHQGMAFLSLVYLLAGRPMQRRFAADPALRATDLLLQERVPRAPAIFPHPAEVSAPRVAAEGEPDLRVFTSPNTPAPEVSLLSNGRYHVVVTSAGAGYSRFGDLAVTRWHEDATRDSWGSFCYLRDVASGSFWSAAHQPTLRRAASYEAIFSPGRAEFRRSDELLATHVEIAVSPEDDIELRQISITNLADTARTIELTSYAEVVLVTPAADAAHRAFSNLFVQTELVRQHKAILCTRRPRSAGERPPWMMHLMTVHGPVVAQTSFETAREAFVGRGRSLADPLVMHRPALGDSEGSVLDPIVAIRNTVEIGGNETVRIHLVTGIAETRAAAMALIEMYTDRHLAERVFELSWTQSQVMQRQLEVSSAQTQLYDRLAGHVLYSNAALRAPRSVIARNHLGQSGLWAYGISGDLPIVLVRIADAGRVGLVRELVRAHAYWHLRGLAVDLVVRNEDPSGYRQSLQETIMAVIAAHADSGLIDRPGGIFVRRGDQMPEEDSVLLQTVARVVLSDADGTLAEQLERRPRELRVPPFVAAEPGAEPAEQAAAGAAAAPPSERTDLTAFNGLGGFTRDGREYVITTARDRRTPAPWCNVIANPYFGTVISESGGAYTWCENAHGYRLTPWHNDPVGDESGEALYVRDESDGRYWSPTPLPVGHGGVYTTRHGFGYSIFEHTSTGISTELSTFVAMDAPVKFLVLKIANRSGRPRRLSLTAYFELVMGAHRPPSAPHVVSEVDLKTGALFARNAYAGEFAQRIALLECSEASRTVLGDRREFLGRNGDGARPQAMNHARLSGRVGAALDPCLAMQVMVDLSDGQEREVAFMFGSGRDLDDARHIVYRLRGTGPAQVALQDVWAFWNRALGAVNVRTPDPTLDFLANGWLIYQVLSCRMWARSGFYQSGGGFGFRDQLQDAAALIHAEPAILREHIIRCAAHQFPDGDVQHWWHPPLGRGVRTRISDDYLWLPSVVCRYVDALGDTGVLDEVVEFIEGRPVQPGEDSYYDLPVRSEQSGTVYEHCVRAVEHGLRMGSHGLPLMGSGDWNDGMNLVGDGGQGESVWLGFFLYDVLIRFASLARRRGDGAFADTCIGEAARLRGNLEQHGWDGEWYRRAYFDDGLPLGSKSNPECAIDSVPQSWSVLAGAATPERGAQALAALDTHLVDRELAVIRLFDPPFDRSELDPGYVKGYVPGVRENGGQYTHAAVWAVMAFAAAGDRERAWELFRLINPIHHGSSQAAIATYRVEPYVVAADVYTSPQHAGRGGWTWYTGSAGWMYRLIVESLLGIQLEVDHLRIAPLVPPAWQDFDVHYRWRQTVHHIHVVHAGGDGQTVTRVVADGVEQLDHRIPLRDDRNEHWCEVTLGGGR